MTQTTHPDKQKVRDWMNRPREERAKVQTPEEFKQQMGWRLIEAEQAEAARRELQPR